MPAADSDDNRFNPGEDWSIDGLLLDREGNPLDLTDAVVRWTLLDQGDAPVDTNATITVLDPPTAGIVEIRITATSTATAPAGLYTGELHITLHGRTSIVRGVSIIVVANIP